MNKNPLPEVVFLPNSKKSVESGESASEKNPSISVTVILDVIVRVQRKLKKEEGSEDSEDRISLSVGEGLVLRYANEHKQGHIVRKRVAADEGAQQKETEDPQRDDSLRFFRLRVTFLIVHYLFVTRTLEKKQKGGDHHHHTENERYG